MDQDKKSETIKFIEQLFKESGKPCIDIFGKCQSCKKEVNITIFKKGLEIFGNGGMIKGNNDVPLFKCSECLERDGGMISRTRPEVFSRVCGYLRPVQNFNPGKKAEWAVRKNYDVSH